MSPTPINSKDVLISQSSRGVCNNYKKVGYWSCMFDAMASLTPSHTYLPFCQDGLLALDTSHVDDPVAVFTDMIIEAADNNIPKT